MNEYKNSLTSRGHCRHCIDSKYRYVKRPASLRRPNPRKPEEVYDSVLGLIKSALARGLTQKGWYVTKEAIAESLNIPEHFVAQAFHRLNREGVLSRGRKKAPHDSKRDPWGGNDSAWAPTLYQIL